MEPTNSVETVELSNICEKSMYEIEASFASSLPEISPETQKYVDELAESARKYLERRKLWREKAYNSKPN